MQPGADEGRPGAAGLVAWGGGVKNPHGFCYLLITELLYVLLKNSFQLKELSDFPVAPS